MSRWTELRQLATTAGPRRRAPVPATGSGKPLGTDAEPGPSLSDGVRGPSHPPGRVLCYATANLPRDQAESMVPNIDPEQVRKLAGWGLTQNDIASFVGCSPQPSAYCSEIRLCPIRNAGHGLGSAKSAFHIV